MTSQRSCDLYIRLQTEPRSLSTRAAARIIGFHTVGPRPSARLNRSSEALKGACSQALAPCRADIAIHRHLYDVWLEVCFYRAQSYEICQTTRIDKQLVKS